MRILVRHALFPQHLLEDTTELLFTETIMALFSVARWCAAKAECRPWEARRESTTAAPGIVGDFFLGI
jgi:hypothetical protein